MQHSNIEKPIIAIVGRPNVGKSSLFNKIAGKRIAIVHKMRGVTRDRISATVNWNDKTIFELIDTGGIQIAIDKEEEEPIVKMVQKQVEIAINIASIIIFVTDAIDGVSPEDEIVADLLRKKNKPIIVAANKADNLKLEYVASSFSKFGWQVFPISVLHNKGIEEMMEHIIQLLPKKPCFSSEKTHRVNIALVGRPNVGKSSIFNKLLNEERSIVTPIAGTTRDVIKADLQTTNNDGITFSISDTAGIRKKSKISHSVEYFSLVRAEETIKTSDLIALVIDAFTGPTAQDKAIGALISKHHKPIVLLVNKADLLPSRSPKHLSECVDSIHKELPFIDYAPILFISATTGYGMQKILPTLQHILRNNTAKLPTAMLNKTIQSAYQKVQPPLVSGKVFKVYYATQTNTSPIRLKLFVNNPSLLTKNYESYLIKAIRKTFNLTGVPILFELQGKEKE